MKKLSAVLVLIMAGCFVLMAIGCSKNGPPGKEIKEELHTYNVTSQKVQSYIEATGTVQPDLDGGAKIISPLQGTVEQVFVKIGDKVEKGAALASLRSSDVSDTYASHLSTLAQLRQAERVYKLNKELFEIGAVTKNDLLNSEANYEQAKALSEGLEKKLDIYGVSGKSFRDTLVLKAPIGGFIADIPAHIGDRFDSSTPLMIIANPGKTIVVANIYDSDVVKIRKGEEVTFSADIFPDTAFKGVISYISDIEDMDSKTVKAYIKNVACKGLFKQNMFLKIRILSDEKKLPVVPKTAIIYKDGKFYVNVKNGGQFELKEVQSVKDASDKLMTVEGLHEGDEIVYSAIDMEKP